jgi:putative holliday junction resolvase
MIRLLGIDLGARRIGLAVGDSATGSSRALATVHREDAAADARRIGRIVAEQQVDEVVVGLPLNMDGSEGPQASETRAWAAEVGPALGVPLRWRDERMTSMAAEAALGPPRRGRSGGPPSASARNTRRAVVDRDAARLLVDAELRERAALPDQIAQ